MKLLSSSSNCLKQIQVRMNAIVPNIITDNGTEFVNQTLKDYYKNVRISHQTSVVRTPQQNDVCPKDGTRLVPNPIPQPPYVPPTKNDWDILFQPMFDEFFNPPLSVVSSVFVSTAPRPVDLTGSLVSTSIDQDAPATSNPSTQEQNNL
ncbi:retrovirus-related pol polyprotein from transposon TNT 1-94 [Tanacetum coccineum]